MVPIEFRLFEAREVPTISTRDSRIDEQGGPGRDEAAPSVQRNRESISASGLYFSRFCHIQTASQFYLIFLSHLSRPSLTWFWFLYSIALDSLYAKRFVMLQNRGQELGVSAEALKQRSSQRVSITTSGFSSSRSTNVVRDTSTETFFIAS